METTILPENIKKTSAATYGLIESLKNSGEITEDIFTKISKTLEKTVGKSGPKGEKVQHMLYDENGEIIGRYCNVTHKWFNIDRFAPKSGRVKEMDLIMKKEYTRVSKIKNEAEELFTQLTQADPSEKLELLTKYEELKESAQPQLPTTEEIESVTEGFDTVEELAGELGVDVILEKPTED